MALQCLPWCPNARKKRKYLSVWNNSYSKTTAPLQSLRWKAINDASEQRSSSKGASMLVMQYYTSPRIATRMHASLTFLLEYSHRKMEKDCQVGGGASCRHVIWRSHRHYTSSSSLPLHISLENWARTGEPRRCVLSLQANMVQNNEWTST